MANRLTGMELINRQIDKKKKAAENSKAYRERLKEKTPEAYKDKNKLEMQIYRANLNKRLLQAYASLGTTQEVRNRSEQVADQIKELDNIIEDTTEDLRRPSQRVINYIYIYIYIWGLTSYLHGFQREPGR